MTACASGSSPITESCGLGRGALFAIMVGTLEIRRDLQAKGLALIFRHQRLTSFGERRLPSPFGAWSCARRFEIDARRNREGPRRHTQVPKRA